MINLEKVKSKKSMQELLEFGIINIDKPSGPTSFNVSDFVRNKLKVRKTSHFGTLDPKVTGVLPVAINRGCKFTGYFLGEDKEYVGVMRIHEDTPIEDIKKAIKQKFTGKIIQLPPVKSRVKREEREREVKKFELLEKEGKDILFRVECAGGTYIRKLISDLGDYMKIGAHMLELRRTRAGIFNEDDIKYPSVNLYDFEKAVDEYEKGNEELLRRIVIPAEIIINLHPVVEVKNESIKQLLTGKPVYRRDLKKEVELEKGSLACIFSEEQFIEIARVVDEKNVFAKPEFVLQPIKI